jgi:hypothetical protein
VIATTISSKDCIIPFSLTSSAITTTTTKQSSHVSPKNKCIHTTITFIDASPTGKNFPYLGVQTSASRNHLLSPKSKTSKNEEDTKKKKAAAHLRNNPSPFKQLQHHPTIKKQLIPFLISPSFRITST